MDDIFPAGARVVGYARDSGGREQNLSVIQQREAIGTWCSEHGLILSRIYEDIARSGASVAGRDQFIELITYFSANNGNKPPELGVILWEISRLSRDYNDCQYYLADLRRQGYIIYSLTDNLPPGLDGQMLESMKIWMNAKYLQDLRRNVKRGQHYIARQYHAWYGCPPIGYTKTEEVIGKRRDGSPHIISHLVPNSDVAPLVTRAFAMRAQGCTLLEIHEQTHLFEWVVGYGKMLSNPIYTGINQLGEDTIEGFCPPLVDHDTWMQAERVRLERRGKHGYNHPRAVRSRYWLTGLLHCGVCDSPMTGIKYQKKPYRAYDYYRCLNNGTGKHNCKARLLPKAEIESRVLACVRNVLESPKVLHDIYNEAKLLQQNSMEVRKSEYATIQQKVANNEIQIKRILAAIRDAGHSQALLGELHQLEQHQMDLRQSSVQLEVRLNISDKIPNLSIMDIVSNLQSALDHATANEIAIIIRGICSRVTAKRIDDGYTGSITLRMPGMEGEAIVEL